MKMLLLMCIVAYASYASGTSEVSKEVLFFERADKTESGCISIEEFKPIFFGDKNGEITEKEFVDKLWLAIPKEYAENIFKKADIDNDKILEEAEVSDLFEKFDVDDEKYTGRPDGCVSLDEFITGLSKIKFGKK